MEIGADIVGYWKAKDEALVHLIQQMDAKETWVVPLEEIGGLLRALFGKLARGELPEKQLSEPSKTLEVLGVISSGASLRILAEIESLSPGFIDSLTEAAEAGRKNPKLAIHLNRLQVVQRSHRLSEAFSIKNVERVEKAIQNFGRVEK